MALALPLAGSLERLQSQAMQEALMHPSIAAAVALQGLYFENAYITQLRAGVPAFVKDPTIFGLDVGP